MSDYRRLNGWYKLRWEIIKRDNFTCQYCGRGAPDVKLEVDHKIALADGGTDDPENLVTSCYACNRGKSGLRQSIMLSQLHKNTSKGKAIEPFRQKQILAILKANPTGLRPIEIAKKASITIDNASVRIFRLKKAGLIEKQGLNYYLKDHKQFKCSSCRDTKYIEKVKAGAVSFSPCPYCVPSKI